MASASASAYLHYQQCFKLASNSCSHQVLPFEISVRHAATVVNEMSKAIANTSQSINSNTSIVCTLFSYQKDVQTEEKQQHANRVCNQSAEGCLRGTDLLFSNQAIKY